MSVRIHAIAKETNKTSKEVIEILAGRGYEIKSASSSIDNITAQSLIDELNKQSPKEKSSDDSIESSSVQETSSEPAAKKKVPFVKSKQDLAQEREEKEKEDSKSNKTALQSTDSEEVSVSIPEKKSSRTTSHTRDSWSSTKFTSAAIESGIRSCSQIFT